MYTTITAAEAAALIKNGDSLGLSGFTPAGVPKAVTRELAKIAEAEHAKGNEFQINLFTGASTGQSTMAYSLRLTLSSSVRLIPPTLHSVRL